MATRAITERERLAKLKMAIDSLSPNCIFTCYYGERQTSRKMYIFMHKTLGAGAVDLVIDAIELNPENRQRIVDGRTPPIIHLVLSHIHDLKVLTS